MAQDYSEKAALKLAKETVAQLEKTYAGDPNKIAGAIMKMQEKNPLNQVLASSTSSEIFNQRVGELARTYARVSDGAGGTVGASKQAMEQYRNVVAGLQPNGQGYALSQKTAILANKVEHLVEGIKIPTKVRDVIVDFAEDGARKVAGNAGKFGLAGKAIGAAAGVSVALIGGNASAAELIDAAAGGVSPKLGKLGTLTLGEGSKRGILCESFGQAVVPGVIGTGVGLATSPFITPAGGFAAGVTAAAAVPESVSQASTNACNFVAQKLGF